MDISVTELKKIQLDILSEVHKFCEKHKISYFLTYGTLIGAIRHKGYIPWDDDIDICMPRPDYERFIKIFNDENSKYKFLSNELDPDYPYPYGKVIDTSTVLIEYSSIKYPIGINIDVLPIDGVDESGEILKKQFFLRNLLDVKTIKLSKKRSLLKNTVLLVGKICLFLLPYKFLVRTMVKNAKKYSYQESEYVCCVAGGFKEEKPMLKEYFRDKVLVQFEGNSYYAPIGYDKYLRSIYGDYMVLPPEEERMPHHVFKAYLKNTIEK